MIAQRSEQTECPQIDRNALAVSIEVLKKLADENKSKDLQASLQALSEKVKENRLNLAVLGQMKRGKSSFVNALLGAEILPTGILPLTSVITRIKYGITPAAEIFYRSGQSKVIEVSVLQDYITEAANPGNRKGVTSAVVTYPSELLSMGIDLIDTPGIGSTHLHNTSTTEDYLKEVDAGIVVLSVDTPITAVESDFLRRMRQDIPKLLFVINKIDMVSPAEVGMVEQFLKGELQNRIGIDSPELFLFSARRAMRRLGNSEVNNASGMEPLIKRLHGFASQEREWTLLQSIALDMLRIAGTLRFTAQIGARAQSMSGKELDAKKLMLEEALAKSDQEFKDLRVLLRQDTATILGKVEEDLMRSVAEAIPDVRARLAGLRSSHRSETRQQLGRLLDQFLSDEIAEIFGAFCVREDESVRKWLKELSARFVERTNSLLERLQDAAGMLFDVSVSHIHFSSTLSMESHLYFHTEPIFLLQLDKLIFVLPRFLLRRIAFHRMLTCIDTELGRNSGRIRYDYAERLEKTVTAFERNLHAEIGIVTDSLRRVLNSGSNDEQSSKAILAKLDFIIAQCSSVVATLNGGF